MIATTFLLTQWFRYSIFVAFTFGFIYILLVSISVFLTNSVKMVHQSPIWTFVYCFCLILAWFRHRVPGIKPAGAGFFLLFVFLASLPCNIPCTRYSLCKTATGWVSECVREYECLVPIYLGQSEAVGSISLWRKKISNWINTRCFPVQVPSPIVH